MKTRYWKIALSGAPLFLFFAYSHANDKTFTAPTISERPVRAVYLGSSRSMLARRDAGEQKADEISELLAKTEVNAVVLDAKDDNGFNVLEKAYGDYFAALARRFKSQNAYLICRIVVFKDTRFPKINPAGAIKLGDNSLWADRKGNRWFDPADPNIIAHTLRISRKAVEIGCDELNYDYVRFPSPVNGSLRGAVYPFRGDADKRKALENFFAELRNFSNREYPTIPISVDIFGYVFLVGGVPEVGQHLEGLAPYFDIISPMAYPSHYRCGNFGVKDPNTIPYRVYDGTIRAGIKYLEARGISVKIRPWIQAFDIANTSGCGERVIYGRKNFREQIHALRDLGIESWMAWNPGANYSIELFD